jgi:hypothetical protein
MLSLSFDTPSGRSVPRASAAAELRAGRAPGVAAVYAYSYWWWYTIHWRGSPSV